MISFVTGTDLWMQPVLAQTMFADRAAQFSKRLGWPVDVDCYGYERDNYDRKNPLYIIVADEYGRHAGSMRIMPTTGPTMINEVFASALGCGEISDPSVWECTRFCLSPSSDPKVAAKLFASAGWLMREFQIDSLIAVFDRFMLRRYQRSGVSPEVLGVGNVAGEEVLAGRWRFNSALLADLMSLANLDPLECELSFVNSSLYRVESRKYA